MRRNHYRFRSSWSLPSPPEVVWDVLEDVPGYARWWPEVRRAHIVELAAVSLTCRSLLPYSLVFTSRPAVRDAAGGVLEARLSGDLDGWSRWTIVGDGRGGTIAVFDQEVEVTKRLLRLLDPVARPLFRLNHRLMMRHGRRGLAAHLSRRGASPPR